MATLAALALAAPADAARPRDCLRRPLRRLRRRDASKTRPFRVVVKGTGQVSCQNSTADGLRGKLILLKRKKGQVFKPRVIRGHRVQLRTTISLEHVLNSVVAQIAGAAGSTAEARATFFPTPEAIERCGEDGIRTLPFNGTVVTQGELISE